MIRRSQDERSLQLPPSASISLSRWPSPRHRRNRHSDHRQQLKRGRVIDILQEVAACLIGMEACASSTIGHAS